MASTPSPPPTDQVLLKVHRTPTQCIIDVGPQVAYPPPFKAAGGSEAKTVYGWTTITTYPPAGTGPESFSLELPHEFYLQVPADEAAKNLDAPYNYVQVKTTTTGTVTGDGQCEINVQANVGGGAGDGRRLTGRVKSFTPLLGVGRENTLSPGNMMTFVLTKDGKLESRLSHSDRSEVFATKFQELPKSGEDEEDVEDFFNRPPPPRLTRWQRFRNLFPRDNDKVQKTLNKIEYYEQPIKLGVVLLAILLAIGIFIRWRRRRNGTEGAPGGSRGQVAPSE